MTGEGWPKRILLGSDFLPAIRDALAAALPDYRVDACAPDRIAEQAPEALVISPLRGRVDTEVIAAADACRLIQQFGAGLDGVDVDAATRRHIAVANVPTRGSGNAESVAELVVFFLIGLARDYRRLERRVAARDFGATHGRTLRGSTVGIVGFGGIGQTVAEALRPLGAHVRAVTRRPQSELAKAFGLEWLGSLADLPRLLAESDHVVLALPLNEATRGIIGARELAQMKPGSTLVNVARGALVDHDALVAALESGSLSGAALDVFWQEPMDPDDAIFRHNVLATPHVAGVTELMLRTTARVVAENVRRLEAGQPLRHQVNVAPPPAP